MQTRTEINKVLLSCVAWATANLVLYFGLLWLETSKLPGKDRVSHRAARLYGASLCSDVPARYTSQRFSQTASDANQTSNGDELPGRSHESRLPYRLMAPKKTQENEKYPLLIFLHGAGHRGTDNQKQLLGLPSQMAQPAWQTHFPCYLLAPQCPELSTWIEFDSALIDLFRQAIRELPIDPKRIYLTGLSMGGYGSWHLAAKEPTLFAGVVPICGGGDVKTAPRLINLPIWAVHGDADNVIPADQSRAMVEAIKKAGGEPKYSELPGVGHDSWSQTYKDPNGVLKWLFQQINQHSTSNPLPSLEKDQLQR